MKVKLSVFNSNDFNRQILEVGDQTFHVHDLNECPEDAIIGRDLVDAYDLLEVLKLGYEAGKRGEELEIEETTKE